MTMRDPNRPAGPKPKDEVATRQGSRQKMNVRVLATSLFLIVLIFAGIYLMFLAAPHSENEAPPPPSAQPGTTPAPATPATPGETAPQPSPPSP